MSNDNTWKFQYSGKVGSDMYNVRGDTYDEFVENVGLMLSQIPVILEMVGGLSQVKEPAPTKTEKSPKAVYGDSNELNVVRIDVGLDANKLPTLEFFSAGHQYPDLSYKVGETREKRIAAFMKLLKDTGDWNESHFGAGSSYECDLVATWKPSEKLNSRGNPYKNIVSVRNA